MPLIDVTFDPLDGKQLACRGGARTEYRESASGLRLRVTAAGSRSWSVTYYSKGTKTGRRIRLGNAATMPLKKARELARATLHAVEAEGRDPAAEAREVYSKELQARRHKAEARKAAADARGLRRRSFVDLARAYIEFRRTTPSGRFNRVASKTTLANWSSAMRLYIEPGLEDRRPDQMRPADFLRVVELAVAKGGASQGPRVREILQAVWRWLEPRAENLGVSMPPKSPLVAGLREIGTGSQKRERALSPRELWSFWRATEDDHEAGALRLMLLTASRVREATELPRVEIDLPHKVWRLPAARNKGGRDREIPLSAEALALLKATPRTGSLVFGAPDPFPVTERVRERMRRAAQERSEPFVEWQARDLRRTAATIIGRLGFAPYEVSLVLGHADVGAAPVTGNYNLHDYQERVREALERLGAWVEETVSRTSEPGEVVSIRVRR